MDSASCCSDSVRAVMAAASEAHSPGAGVRRPGRRQLIHALRAPSVLVVELSTRSLIAAAFFRQASPPPWRVVMRPASVPITVAHPYGRWHDCNVPCASSADTNPERQGAVMDPDPRRRLCAHPTVNLNLVPAHRNGRCLASRD